MNLLTVIPYCTKDAELTKTLLTWIAEISVFDKTEHKLLLVNDSAVPADTHKEIVALAKHSFGLVFSIPVSPTQGHAPTQMFLTACRWIYECSRFDFLWLEPDCVPLKPNWLLEIEAEYEICPMKFMGPLIKSDQPNMPAVHLTGCSVYPNDAWEIYRDRKPLQTDNVAWDIEAAPAVVPRSLDTKLIQHFWGKQDQPPVFVESRAANSPENHVTLHFLSPSAVLFHRSKDGSLIKLLRSQVKPKKGRSETEIAKATVS